MSAIGAILSLAGAGASTVANIKAAREQEKFDKRQRQEEINRAEEEAKRQRMKALAGYLGVGDEANLATMKYNRPYVQQGGPNLTKERVVSGLGNLIAQYGPRIGELIKK